MKVHAPGMRIGQYEIAGRPMVGGMGIVYVCRDLEQDRPVALKTFQPRFLPNRAARDRFLREGTHWLDLSAHPHIVRCYEVLHIDPEVYLVLELVAKEQGREDASLRSWLVPGHPLPVEIALLFALQVARGMAHAVATIPGFVHRDLKPENVLVGADRLAGTVSSQTGVNRLRVTDFGLAAVLEEAGSRMQDTGSKEQEAEGAPANVGRTQLTRGVVGTPLYMAPEQWRGEPVGVYTDVYALGCILAEMLTGRRVVEGGTLGVLERAHCAEKRRQLPAGLPRAVEEVVTCCLALEPGARYRSWEEVEEALREVYRSVLRRPAPPVSSAAVLSRGERLAVGWSYSALGASYLDIGKVRIAQSYFEQVRDVAQKESEPLLEADGLNHLGQVHAALGEASQAIACHEQALATACGIREMSVEHSVEWMAGLYSEGIILGSLGNAYADLGDVPRASDCLERALTIARKLGDRHTEGAILGNLGAVQYRRGNMKQAIAYHKQALQVAREVGDRQGEGNALGNLGEVHRKLGDTRQALRLFEQHLKITRQIGDRRGEGTVLGNLGNIYSDLGQREQAIDYYEQALVVTREVGDRRGEGIALTGLGNICKNGGRVWQAIEYYKQALEIDREVGDRRGEGYDLMGLGNAYSDLGDVQRAVGYYEQAGAALEGIGDLMGSASVSFNLALVLVQNGHLARALPHAERAAQVFANIGHVQHARQAQRLVADIRMMAF